MKKLLIALLLITQAAQAGIRFDNVGSGFQAATTQLSYTITVAAHASIVVVGVGDQSQAISSVSYNGTNMTSLRADSFTSLWYLVNPTSGTQTILVNPAASSAVRSGAMSFFGVNVANPIDNSNGNSTSTSQSITPNASNTMLVSVATSPTSGSITAANGQNLEWSVNTGTSVTSTSAGGYLLLTQATAFSDNWNNGGAGTRGITDATLNPDTSGDFLLLFGEWDPLKALFDLFLRPALAADFDLLNQKRNAWNSHPLEYRSASR